MKKSDKVIFTAIFLMAIASSSDVNAQAVTASKDSTAMHNNHHSGGWFSHIFSRRSENSSHSSSTQSATHTASPRTGGFGHSARSAAA